MTTTYAPRHRRDMGPTLSDRLDVARCEQAGDHLIATRHRRDECPFATEEA